MSYNILKAKIEFKDNVLTRVVVLVEISKGDIRLIAADSKPANGYMFILPGTVVSNSLLQEVAGYGKQIIDKAELAALRKEL